MAGGNLENGGPKTLINRGLKNPKRYKHASQVRDGLNTVRDFEVLISLGSEIAQTLKTRQGHFSEASFWGTLEPFWPFLAFRRTYILGLFKQLQTEGSWVSSPVEGPGYLHQ